MSSDPYWSSAEGLARQELRERYLERARKDAEQREQERRSEWEVGEGRPVLLAWKAEVRARRLESLIPDRVWTRVERVLAVIWLSGVVGASVASLFLLGLVWGLLVTVAIAFASWIPLSILTVVCTQTAAAFAAKRAGLDAGAVVRVLFGIESPEAPPRPLAPLRAWNAPRVPELAAPYEEEPALSYSRQF